MGVFEDVNQTETVLNAATLQNLRAAEDVRIRNGKLAFVREIGEMFFLDKNSSATVDNVAVVATRSGLGRWIRRATDLEQQIISISERAGDSTQPMTTGLYATAHSIILPAGVETAQLNELAFWSPIPAASGETELIRLYRYRKDTPTGSFFIDQITDSYTYSNGDPWAFWIDLSDNIRDGFTLTRTDSIAISRLYTAGGGPAMKYSRVRFNLKVVEPGFSAVAASSPVSFVWPPS